MGSLRNTFEDTDWKPEGKKERKKELRVPRRR
jgi:hypothetical protein